MADKSGIDVLLNFIVNNNQAIKNINNINNSVKNNTKTVNDNSTTIKNNSKVVNDSRTIINNKTVIVNKNTDAVNKNASAYGGLKLALAGVSAAFAAVSKMAASTAIEFEAAMRNVNSIARQSEEQFQRLSEGVREVAKMKEIKDTATGVAKAMYTIVSSGFAASEALQLSAVASKAASAGMTTTETAVSGLTILMNSYNQKTVKDSIKFSDQLFNVVDKGVITFEQLSTSLGSVVSQASSAGVKFEEVGGAFIQLTKLGINASESETAIANLIRTIVSPDDGAIEAAKNMGIEWGALALEQKGLTGMMQELYKATGGATEKIAELVPEARAQKAALNLAKGGAIEYTEAVNSMSKATDGAGTTQRALNEQMKSAQFQISQTKSYIEDLKIEFGEFISKASLPFMKDIQGIIEFLTSLSDETKENIVQFGLITAAVIAFSVGIGGLVLVAGPLLGLIGSLIGGVGTGFIGLYGAVSALVWLFGPTGGFLIGVAGAKLAVAALGRILNQVKDAYGWLKSVAQEHMDWSGVKQDRENAFKLIQEFNKIQHSKEKMAKLTASELKQYALAHQLRSSEVKNLQAKEGLQKKSLQLAQMAKNIESKAAADKAAAEAKAAADKERIRNAEIAKQITTGMGGGGGGKVTSKAASIEDFTNEMVRLRSDLVNEEKQLTLTDFQYKVWSITQEYQEKKAMVEKAIKLKQASDKDLVQLGRGTALELQQVNNEYQASILKKEQEAAEKKKLILEDAAEKKKQLLEQEQKDREEAGRRERDQLHKLLEEEKNIHEQKQAFKQEQINYYTTVGNMLSKYTGEFGKNFGKIINLYQDLTKIITNPNLLDSQKTLYSQMLLAPAIIETIGDSIATAGSAFKEYFDVLKSGNATTKDFVKFSSELAGAIPGIGEYAKKFSNFIYDSFGMNDESKQDAKMKVIKEFLSLPGKMLEQIEKQKEEQLKIAEALKNSLNKIEDQILDKKKAVIQRLYEAEKEATDKIYEAKKEVHKEAIKGYDDEINKLKTNLNQISDEIAKRQQKQAASQESSKAFQAQRAKTLETLDPDFFRTPEDMFEIQNNSAIAELQNKFAMGDISLDDLNKNMMELSVKRNIFYSHITDNLVKGTKEHLDYQKKANDAFTDYASYQQEATVQQMQADAAMFESQKSGFESLKETQLNDLSDIELAHEMALINLENTWKTPAGAFRSSMEEALSAVSTKMDATMTAFIERSKAAINTLQAQKQIEAGKSAFGGGLGGLGGTVASTAAATMSTIKIPVPMPGGGVMYIEPFKQKTDSVLGSNVGRPNFGGIPGLPGMPSFAKGGIMNAGSGAPALLHNSEMILNPSQQANLFNMINSPKMAMSGGINVVINTGAINNQSDIRSLANAVGNVIRQELLR